MTYNKQYYDKIICSHSECLGHYAELIADQKSVALITHNLSFRAGLGDLELKLIIDKLGSFVFRKIFESEAAMNAEVNNQLNIIQTTIDKNFKKHNP